MDIQDLSTVSATMTLAQLRALVAGLEGAEGATVIALTLDLQAETVDVYQANTPAGGINWEEGPECLASQQAQCIECLD